MFRYMYMLYEILKKSIKLYVYQLLYTKDFTTFFLSSNYIFVVIKILHQLVLGQCNRSIKIDFIQSIYNNLNQTMNKLICIKSEISFSNKISLKWNRI